MSAPIPKFTIAGREYCLKCLTGAIPYKFTRIAIGDGALTGQAPAARKALVHEVLSIPVTDIRESPEQYFISLSGPYLSQDLTGPFYWRELGIYAEDPELGEVLYAYGNAFDLADYIDPATQTFEEVLSVGAFVGDVDVAPIITIDRSLVWATHKDLDALRVELEADDELQAQISAMQTALAGKEPSIAIGSTGQYWRGDKTWQDLAAAVRAAVLTGLSTATNAAITAGDTILAALGKLQKQITDLAATVAGKAPTSHASTESTYGLGSASNYGHAMASSAAPLANGTAAVGTDNGKFAREGHVHPSDGTRVPLAGGVTMTGQLTAVANAAVGASQVRNIYAGTADMTAGVSSLATGVLYFMYE